MTSTKTVSKKGHILSFWVDVNLGAWDTIQTSRTSQAHVLEGSVQTPHPQALHQSDSPLPPHSQIPLRPPFLGQTTQTAPCCTRKDLDGPAPPYEKQEHVALNARGEF